MSVEVVEVSLWKHMLHYFLGVFFVRGRCLIEIEFDQLSLF